MTANEFIKKVGWDEAISFTDWYGGNTAFKFLKVKEKTISVHSGDQPYDFHINDLKRLVESHEIIQKDFGGVEMADYEHMISGCYSDPYWIRVKQAIADVESCQ